MANFQWITAMILLVLHRTDSIEGCTDGEIRLANGASPREGRVEICKDSTWGTVCHSHWNNQDARVVCRQLGLSEAGSIFTHTGYFGEGTGPIHYNQFTCFGTEARLVDCPSGSTFGCTHRIDAGVICHIQTDCEDGEIRLIGGTSSLEGRVEVCYSGVWGTVCDNQWTNADASVVCRQLGFSSLGAIPIPSAAFGQGNEPTFFNNVRCGGMERTLFDCVHDGLEIENCGHHQDAGVICTAGCASGEVRLVGGNSAMEGRVEICLNDEWGTVCDQMWNETDAAVVCRQLGLDPENAEAISQARFGEETGRIWLENVTCSGYERELGMCAAANLSETNLCTHAQDAGVRCFNGCMDGDVRLADGSTRLEGRIEICLNNVWGTVCHQSWDHTDARIACSQLGFAAVGSTSFRDAAFGQGSGPIHIFYFSCEGRESMLIDCRHSTFASGCGHHQDAGVRCLQREDNCEDGDLRLADGSSPFEGRVEMCYSGVWGTVCHNEFGDLDATVVCRQLGYSTTGATPMGNAAYGQGSGPILLDLLRCRGFENRLLDCAHRGQIDPRTCFHSQDVGVVCIEGCTTGDVRLVGGNSSLEGRVEVCLNDEWGTVCDQMWDESDAAVVCKQLGLSPEGLEVFSQASFGEGARMVWLRNVSCSGDERKLVDCMADSNETGMQCSHSQDAGVRCSAGCPEGELRLVEGLTHLEGRVVICRDSQWGTVCHQRFFGREANVVCRQLGYSGLGSTAVHSSSFGEGFGPIFVTSGCSGSESRLIECPETVQGGCAHNTDAGVRCIESTSDCEDGELRLADGASSLEGRVEMCYSGVWGTVCHNEWGAADATVVCRQLGYSTTGATPRRDAAFGQGTGPILLDFVRCNGLENRLLDCTHRGIEPFTCGHGGDAGVICAEGCTEGEVRLVDGMSGLEGRVEICLNDEWGTVCDQMWDETDAAVVCRQLGLNPEGLEAFAQASFGEGTGQIWLTNTSCTGVERELADCMSNSNVANTCTHSQDSAVRCSAGCIEGEVRLVEGATKLEGRVEICKENLWGTVCNSRWDLRDSRVVCRQLGFAVAGSVPLFNIFDQRSGPIHYGDFNCGGTETRLFDCPSSVSATCGGNHASDAGVRCSERSDCEDGDVRLVGGTSSLEGRVEMCYSGVWGTICDNLWSADDASVVCRQLGFSSRAIPREGAAYGQGSGPIFLEMLRCNGQESSLLNCTRGGQIEFTRCGHHQDAGVVCVEGCSTGKVRLVGGNSSLEGRVELCLNNEWGTVCDQMWNETDAAVVCRQLGYGPIGPEALGQASFGEGEGRIWLKDVDCSGSERRLDECSASFDATSSCTHSQDAGIRCLPGCIESDIRLADGVTELEGRVEICRQNEWGTVCHTHWNKADATVVCRQLGLSVAGSVAYTDALFGQGLDPIQIGQVGCRGDEGRLADCSSGSTSGCGHQHDAGVRCQMKTGCKDGDIRLVGGNSTLEGRVEMCYSGVWGTVCNDQWNEANVNVTCGQLGLDTAGATTVDSSMYGQGIGPIFLDNVVCTGQEERLVDCSHAGIEMGDCDHTQDVGIICSELIVSIPGENPFRIDPTTVSSSPGSCALNNTLASAKEAIRDYLQKVFP